MKEKIYMLLFLVVGFRVLKYILKLVCYFVKQNMFSYIQGSNMFNRCILNVYVLYFLFYK